MARRNRKMMVVLLIVLLILGTMYWWVNRSKDVESFHTPDDTYDLVEQDPKETDLNDLQHSTSVGEFVDTTFADSYPYGWS